MARKKPSAFSARNTSNSSKMSDNNVDSRKVCSYCKEAFNDDTARKNHESLQHWAKMPLTMFRLNKRGFNPQDGFKCKYCGTFFSSKNNVMEHKRRSHWDEMTPVEKKLLNFKCKYCRKHFDTKSKLREHIRELHLDKMSMIPNANSSSSSESESPCDIKNSKLRKNIIKWHWDKMAPADFSSTQVSTSLLEVDSSESESESPLTESSSPSPRIPSSPSAGYSSSSWDERKQYAKKKKKPTRRGNMKKDLKNGSRSKAKGKTTTKMKTCAPKANKTKPNSQKSNGKTAVNNKNFEVASLSEMEECFRPPAWLAESVPRKNPYFPQLGDDLVYFRQGHALYLKKVEEQNTYVLNERSVQMLPYVRDPNLPPEISVRVVHIKFELYPPRLIVLKLERTNWDTGEKIAGAFTVRYHPMKDSKEFLILRQIYDKSMSSPWIRGEMFKSLKDTTWWLGTVMRRKPFDNEHPDSSFLALWVKWNWDKEGQQYEQLSPWDMERLPDNFVKPEKVNEGIPATDADMKDTSYNARAEDWLPQGRESACKRMSALLQSVMDFAIAQDFSSPTDMNRYPAQASVIEYFMDLSLIKARLNNLFYRRPRAILTDSDRIAINAKKLNQPDSDVVKHASVISDLLHEIVNNYATLTPTDLSDAYRRLIEKHNPTTAIPTNLQQSSHATNLTVNLTTRTDEGLKEQSKKTPSPNIITGSSSSSTDDDDDDENVNVQENSWQMRCQALTNEMWKDPDILPFCYPSWLEPNYSKVITTPISLSQIREDLNGANYKIVHEFHKDMLLLFANAQKYYKEPGSTVRLMALRAETSYMGKMECILCDYNLNGRRRKSNKGPSNNSQTPRKSPVNKKSAASPKKKIPPRLNKSAPATGKRKLVMAKTATALIKPVSSNDKQKHVVLDKSADADLDQNNGLVQSAPRSQQSKPSKSKQVKIKLVDSDGDSDSDEEEITQTVKVGSITVHITVAREKSSKKNNCNCKCQKHGARRSGGENSKKTAIMTEGQQRQEATTSTGQSRLSPDVPTGNRRGAKRKRDSDSESEHPYDSDETQVI